MAMTQASRRAQARYRTANRAKINARARARYVLNREKERLRRVAYNAVHREELRAKWRAYDATPERKARKAELERTEKRKAARRIWRKKNAEKIRAWHAAYEKAYRAKRKELHGLKQASDPQYRLRRTLRSSLKNAIRNEWRGGSAIANLGCSIDELRAHLERQWLTGMSWGNFGLLRSDADTWQIDHIEPLSSFDLTSPSQVAVACHYTNLAPLWAIDNRRKGNKTISRLEVFNDL